MRQTHFHPKAENDSFVSSFSTNDIIKANSPAVTYIPLDNYCSSYQISNVRQKQRRHKKKGGKLSSLVYSLQL